VPLRALWSGRGEDAAGREKAGGPVDEGDRATGELLLHPWVTGSGGEAHPTPAGHQEHAATQRQQRQGATRDQQG
jgi:hypothetical protein